MHIVAGLVLDAQAASHPRGPDRKYMHTTARVPSPCERADHGPAPRKGHLISTSCSACHLCDTSPGTA
eukprot:9042215-Pyramimonas_sp.AAC.1